jgi:hypothetical protein
MYERFVLVVILLGAARTTVAAATASGPSPLASVVEIDHRCDAAEKAASAKPDRFFAEVSGMVVPGKGQGRWRELADAAALKVLAEEDTLNTQGYVTGFRDQVLFVEMFFTSGTGDWGHYSDLCFRADGTLARVTDALNTFKAVVHGDQADSHPGGSGVMRIRIRYFAADGHAMQKKSRLLDLRTRKPVKGEYMDQDDVIYHRVADVPFYALLSRRRPIAAPPNAR